MRRMLFGLITILVLLTPLGIPPSAAGAPDESGGEWQVYTNTNDINDLAAEGAYVWAATEGGVVRWNRTDGSYVKYTTDDGLASNVVTGAAVDASGTKWFATMAGVSKLAGSTWTTYNSTNSGLPGDRVQAVSVGASGTLWFACYDTGNNAVGVVRFDGSDWTAYDMSNSGLPSLEVTDMVYGAGKMWFSTRRYWDNDWVGGGVASFDGAVWATYSTANSGLVSDDVRAAAVDGNGVVWFGASGYWLGSTWVAGGASAFDGATWTSYTWNNSGLVDWSVYAVAITPGGQKWFGYGYGSGATQFDGTTWTTYNTSNSGLVDNRVIAIAASPDGYLWFGTQTGLSGFDGVAWTTLITPDGPLGDVQDIAVDHAGHIWYATYDGVVEFDGGTWTLYDTSNSGLPSNYASVVAVGADDHKWFASYGGAHEFDGVNWTSYTPDNSGLPDSMVRVISVDPEGNVWFGTYYGGVAKYDGTTWTVYNPSNSGLAGTRIEAIVFDSQGRAWISSLEPAKGLDGGSRPGWAYAKGVQVFDGTTWTTYDTSNSGLVDDWVWDIAIDSQDHKWFAAWGGVSEFFDTTWVTYDTNNSGLADGYVYKMRLGPDGEKWFGYGYTGAGTSVYDGTLWTTYTTQNSGLGSGYVECIAVDHSDHIWFGTNEGASEYIPDRARGTVTVSGGGTVTSNDGSTVLAFAPGAVEADLDVTFIPNEPWPAYPLRGIRHFFRLYAVPAGTDGPPVETIPGTYTITVQYTDGEAFAVVESTLALYRWDGNQWVQEATSVVDPDTNTVTATPNRFSHWAVLGVPRDDLQSVFFPLVARKH